MKRIKFASHLRLFFLIAVVIPCIVLTVIAIRSIKREKAYIEKRFQETLATEITYTASLLDQELEKVIDELTSTSPSDMANNPDKSLSEWKTLSLLVNVPFLLSSDFEILWPKLSLDLNEDELAFLNWNREFIANRAVIPVYQNIALAYKDQIIDAEKKSKTPVVTETEQESNKPPSISGKPLEKTQKTDDMSRLESKPQTSISTSSPKKVLPRQPDKEISRELEESQKALREFGKSESLRQQVYKQAQEEGQKTSTRNVTPSAGMIDPETVLQEPESIFISEPRRFEEIISEKDTGIIPRFIEEKLTLLFWKKETSGQILGCLIDSGQFRNRVIGLLPDLYSEARIMTILDENGRPLVSPDDIEVRDWSRPFVAQEISELLPRWEVAAYLTDPDAITSKANLTALIMWILILILFVSIISGGTYVLNILRSEMDLAQKKTSFVANVSHELKTPLTSIRMFAEMLKQRRQPDREKQEKYLNIMVSETERLTRLINNVLDFSRMEKSKKQYNKKNLDIGFLCEDLMESQRIRLEHIGFLINFTNDPGPVFVDGDEEALKQALLNLLSNAEKYSEQEKKIDVEVSRTDEAALINIKDRGIGIAPEHAKKIFREFYRVDESLASKVRGSGLGLTIALKIIRDHEGDILYFPRDEGGSVFQIKLPLKGKK